MRNSDYSFYTKRSVAALLLRKGKQNKGNVQELKKSQMNSGQPIKIYMHRNTKKMEGKYFQYLQNNHFSVEKIQELLFMFIFILKFLNVYFWFVFCNVLIKL